MHTTPSLSAEALLHAVESAARESHDVTLLYVPLEGDASDPALARVLAERFRGTEWATTDLLPLGGRWHAVLSRR